MTTLAKTYGAIGQVEEGLKAVQEVLVAIGDGSRHFLGSEAKRIEGELRLHPQSPDPLAAESCFQQALEIARRQKAKSWELRAATSLARLWQSQDKRQDAHDLLAPVYDWFTEGFDTADLQEAKTLMDELSAEVRPPKA